jgi:protein NrfD
MKNSKNFTLIYWAAVAVMLILGVFGLYWRLTTGHEMANYGQLIVWGLWVVMYIFFVGISAGSFMLVALAYTFGIERFRPLGRLALLTSLVALPVGLLNIWFDLGHMERFFETLTRPSFSSMLPYEIWLYTGFLIVLALMIWVEFRKGDQDKSKTLKILSTIGFVMVILFESAGGAIYGVDKARPLWHGGLIPLLFLLSALSVGTATVTGIYAFFSKDRGTEKHRELVADLGKLMLGFVVLEALFTFASYFVAFYGAVPSEITPLKTILVGPLWFIFWIGQIGLGLVLPVFLLWWNRTRKNPAWVGVAGFGIMIATLAMRWNLIVPALALPELQGLIDATPSPRITSFYVPSMMEWFLSIGFLGLGLAAFAIGAKWFLSQPQDVKEASNG